MSQIKTADFLLRWLEDGALAYDLGTEVRDTLATLKEQTAYSPKAKAKGSVRLDIKFTVESGIVTIECDVTSKRPKPPRALSVAWVLDDGTLSTQHPKQIDMFPAPVRSAAAE